MKFIHVTDIHLVSPHEKLWGFDTFERLDLCLTDIAKFHADAQFCAISGDLTERGEPAAYATLKQRLAKFPFETHLMLGNHDSRPEYLKVFGGADAFGFVQHSMVRDGRHFLFLDTLKGGDSSAGLLDAPRRAWLKSALEKSNGAATYIFLHHPPFLIHHPLMDLIPLEDGEGFGDMLKGHNVRHIFFGHAHRMISGHWRGISYSSLPGLCHQLPLVGGSVSTVYSEEPPMYSVVYLENEQVTVHTDAFLNRSKVAMADDAERGNWS
jgi:3',5'-cyclic AMP phosphodiesterase CpdA